MPSQKEREYYELVRLTVDTFSDSEQGNGSMPETARLLGVDRTTVSRRLSAAEKHGIHAYTDLEIFYKNIDLAKQKQALSDTNRIERKSFRERARVENAVSEYQKEIVSLLSGKDFYKKTAVKSKPKKQDSSMLVHWSDHHLNERIQLSHNTYDWNVASKRLMKHVMAVKRHAKAHDIKHIHVQFTGDMINSDRRMDELLANAGNRAKATVLAVDLYSQALMDLAQDFYVTYSGISGNESRLGQNVSWEDEGATDNFDFTIYEMLHLVLQDKVTFLRPQDPRESLIEISGQNILSIHGDGAVGVNNLQKSVQAIKGRYVAQGIKVDIVIWGHIHEAVIADWYARSASLAGSNTYNERALNLAGRASQNIYIVYQGGGFDGIKIDLQNTDGIKGYNLDSRLHAYATKAANKLHKTDTIMKIVV